MKIWRFVALVILHVSNFRQADNTRYDTGYRRWSVIRVVAIGEAVFRRKTSSIDAMRTYIIVFTKKTQRIVKLVVYYVTFARLLTISHWTRRNWQITYYVSEKKRKRKVHMGKEWNKKNAIYSYIHCEQVYAYLFLRNVLARTQIIALKSNFSYSHERYQYSLITWKRV